MTVCGGLWDLLRARVVCRMLGFDGALEAPRSVRFGQGSGDNIGVDCRGTEDSLQDCSRVWLDSSCGHQRDAGAVCYSGGKNSLGNVETTILNFKLHTVKIAKKNITN